MAIRGKFIFESIVILATFLFLGVENETHDQALALACHAWMLNTFYYFVDSMRLMLEMENSLLFLFQSFLFALQSYQACYSVFRMSSLVFTGETCCEMDMLARTSLLFFSLAACHLTFWYDTVKLYTLQLTIH